MTVNLSRVFIGRVVLLLLTAGLFCAATWGHSAEITLHPKATAYPAPCAGPFVQTNDGAILSLEGTSVYLSRDGGKEWNSAPVLNAEKYSFGDREIVRSKNGVIVCVFCNNKEIRQGKGWNKGSVSDWEIPVYSIRSVDNGHTWSEPILIQRDWVGAMRAAVALSSGRIVVATMALVPWHHVIPVWYSDDDGQSWVRSETIDMEGSKINDHDGAMEPKLVELADGSIFMLIRTTRGTFYRSISTDGGVSWSKPESTGIENNNSFGELARLADGRLILIWNRDEKFPAFNYTPDPNDWTVEELSYSWIRRRNKLSVAFSSDDGQTWTDPVVIAQTPDEKFWIAYTVFFEPEPGVFWMTTGQGGVKLAIREKDLR